MKIFASILNCDFSILSTEIKKAEEAGVDGFHLDVMDGHFVPNISFGIPITSAVRKVTSLPVRVHLMIENPSKYAEEFIKNGADAVIYHVETHYSEDLAKSLQGKGIPAGIALNPDTPVEMVEHFLPYVEEVLFMTVYPGFGGQSLIPSVLKKIEEFSKKHSKRNFVISADGGINPKNAKYLKDVGVDVVVVGSAIFKSNNYKEVVEKIKNV